MPNEGEGGSLDFLEHFSELEDPRQRAKVLYPLDEVLLLTLCAVLSGAKGWGGPVRPKEAWVSAPVSSLFRRRAVP